MQINIHTGAHCTDDDRLLKCLLRNKAEFARRGVAVPGPGRYRTLLKETFQALENAEPSPEAHEVLLDAILDEESAERMILTNAHFFGSQRFAIEGSSFYPHAPARIAQFRQLFKPESIRIYMAIRNPATFIPALLGGTRPENQYAVLSGIRPDALLWSDLVMRIRDAVPAVPLTLWCNEDTPLIWAEIIRDLAGLEPGERITGGFDLLAEIMSGEGMRRFRQYLHRRPEMPEPKKRRIMMAFLAKYAIEDRIEEELDLPGWTHELVERMTAIYDQDVDRIAAMKGVTVISP